MPEPEPIEQLLRRAMPTERAPRLSPEFEQRLAQRLQTRRLSPRARYTLWGYGFLGFALSLGTMRLVGMDLRLAVASVLVPLVLVVPLVRSYFR